MSCAARSAGSVVALVAEEQDVQGLRRLGGRSEPEAVINSRSNAEASGRVRIKEVIPAFSERGVAKGPRRWARVPLGAD